MPATSTSASRKRIRGYTFKRLPKDVRDHALEQLRERLYHNMDSCDIAEAIEEHVKYCHGFNLTVSSHRYRRQDNGIYWSLGHCQGDGVSFDGSLDIDAVIDHPANGMPCSDSGPPRLTGDAQHDLRFTSLADRKVIAEIVDRLSSGDATVSVELSASHHGHCTSVDLEVYDEPEFDRHVELMGAFLGDLPTEARDDHHVAGLLPAVGAPLARGDTLNLLVLCDRLDEIGQAVGVPMIRTLCRGQDAWDTDVSNLKDAIESYVSEVASSAEKAGYAEIEHQTYDEENVIEMAETNEWRFDREGNLI